MKKLRTAVVGAGKMGRLHTRIYSEMEQVELVGVVDTQLEKAQPIAQQYNTKAFTDINDIIDRPHPITGKILLHPLRGRSLFNSGD